MALLTINTFVIAAILRLRKTKEENLSIIDRDSIEDMRTANDRIWRTALLVNCLTLLVTVGFAIAQQDIQEKLNIKKNGAAFESFH